MGNKEIHIFALAAHGEGISGGDRIFIEFARNWSKNYPVRIYVWEEGYQMLKRQHLVNSKINPSTSVRLRSLQALGTRNQKSKLKVRIIKMKPWSKLGFLVNYLARIIEGIRIGLTLKKSERQNVIIYSASEFWMDSLTALLLKLRFPKITWIAAWYQTAPKPWEGYTEGPREEKFYFQTLIYWLVQLPIKPLVENFADFILVNNALEKKQFPKLDKKSRVIVVLGAVFLEEIEKWKRRLGNLPKIYDAVFQGRFHPQKGVLELIDIWNKVVKRKNNAKLALIGDGPLMDKVRTKIRRYGLEENIKVFGYLFDGEEKFKIFSQSKIVLHPAFYDSGGMAAYEVMVFELPCIGFNLASYDSYYPKGMEKVPVGNLEAFAAKILQLLFDKKLYNKVSKDAYQLVKKMTWDIRSRQILNRVLE